MRAQGDDTAGEVVGYGTYEEDGPVTWETLTFPREVAVCGVPQQESPRAPVFRRVHTEVR